MNDAADSMIPQSDAFDRHDTQPEFERLKRLIKQARPYLPETLLCELVLALFDFSDAQVETYKRDLAEVEFGGRGPERRISCR